MKVIIAGPRKVKTDMPGWEPRDITLYEVNWIHECLDDYHGRYPITEVVCGMAKGIDLIGRAWGIMRGIPIKEMGISKNDWVAHGNFAGPKRNMEMGDYADRAIIFWDGISRGSKHMYDYMHETLEKPVTRWDLPYFDIEDGAL